VLVLRLEFNFRFFEVVLEGLRRAEFLGANPTLTSGSCRVASGLLSCRLSIDA
jgi:hypothetical protein